MPETAQFTEEDFQREAEAFGKRLEERPFSFGSANLRTLGEFMRWVSEQNRRSGTFVNYVRISLFHEGGFPALGTMVGMDWLMDTYGNPPSPDQPASPPAK